MGIEIELTAPRVRRQLSGPAWKFGRSIRFASVIAVLATASLTGAFAAEVWMASLEPVWRAIHGWPANDYMRLFQADAPWGQAARGVKVFEVYKKFVEQSSDEDLSKVLGALSRRGMALAMQGTPLIASEACGLGVEGYGPPHDMKDAAARVKRLGGIIDYIALDEPLYYGHVFTRRPLMNYETQAPAPCHSPIAELARETALKIAEVRQVFPELKIGDVEPAGVFPAGGAEFRRMLREWFQAYEGATGRKFAFFDIDVVWLQPDWQSQFDDAVSVVREAGIPLGVIFNGTPTEPTDAAWLTSARAHIRLVESKLGRPPDRAIFQSWTDHPRRILPETEPDSFTNLIKTYVESH